MLRELPNVDQQDETTLEGAVTAVRRHLIEGALKAEAETRSLLRDDWESAARICID